MRTRVGYTGGTTPAPSYRKLGDHTEAFQLDYLPARISYAELLDLFWRGHDYGRKAGSVQYRAAVFAGPSQLAIAGASRERLRGTVFTEVVPLGEFTRAEDHHQKYRLRQKRPLVEAFTKAGYSDRELVDSTIAARLNGYLGGPEEAVLEELRRSGFPVELLG